MPELFNQSKAAAESNKPFLAPMAIW
jgi:hypothetical protein